jgi:hypothetical protein
LDIRHFEERQKLEYNIKIYFEKIVAVWTTIQFISMGFTVELTYK